LPGSAQGKILARVGRQVLESKTMHRRFKILMVDDDVDLLEELSDFLSAAGYEVVSFTDGDKALRAAASVRPDIVLVDLKMKGISGFRVAEEIRKMELLAGIPIIAMTGYYTRPEDEKLMKECGIQACLHKPFSAEMAARKLGSCLRNRIT